MNEQRELHQLFSQELDRQTLQATRAVLDLEAFKEGALTRLKIAIHSIKSASRIVLAYDIEQCCHQIEELILAVEQKKVAICAPVVELLLQTLDVLSAFSNSDRDTYAGQDTHQLLTLLQEKLKACLLEKTYQPSTQAHAAFSFQVDEKNNRLSIEGKQARHLLGLSREILNESVVLQRGGFSDDQRELALKNHIVSCNKMCLIAKEMQMVPFALLADRLPRYVRDLAISNDRFVKLFIIGQRELVDREVLNNMKLSLLQLIKNAVAHGIEPASERMEHGKPAQGKIVIEVANRNNRLIVRVTDDGRGVDFVKIREKAYAHEKERKKISDATLPFVAGVSTQNIATMTSGRGVGLSQVRKAVQDLGGTVEMDSLPHIGTTVQLNLPVTLSCVSVLVVDIGGELYGISSAQIERVDCVLRSAVIYKKGVPYLLKDGIEVKLINAGKILGYQSELEKKETLQLVFVLLDHSIYALVVDAFRGTEEVIVQGNQACLAKMPGIMGCALSYDNKPLLLLQLDDLIYSNRGEIRAKGEPLAVVFGRSPTVSYAAAAALKKAGYSLLVSGSPYATIDALRKNPDTLFVFCGGPIDSEAKKMLISLHSNSLFDNTAIVSVLSEALPISTLPHVIEYHLGLEGFSEEHFLKLVDSAMQKTKKVGSL